LKKDGVVEGGTGKLEKKVDSRKEEAAIKETNP